MNPAGDAHGLIGVFARHPVACNLLMIIMLISGVIALQKLNKQFFPNFDLDYITVDVVWRGASPEDVEESITQLLEDEFRTLKNMRKLTSNSAEGLSTIFIEYDDSTDLGRAQDEVTEFLGRIRNLPKESERPRVSVLENREIIARLVVASPDGLSTLRPLVKRFERELLSAGINDIAIVGLPEEEIAIQIPQAQLHQLGLSLPGFADLVQAQSQDIPAGNVGRADVARQLRSVEQRRTAAGFESVPLILPQSQQLLRLSDVAEIERRPMRGQPSVSYRGMPAVQMNLQRAQEDDALDVAKILDAWFIAARAEVPESVQMVVYDEQWKLIKDRIDLLLKNGASGLLLIIVVLFIFLNGRVAFWVVLGIPVSFAATLMALYLFGGSINMISLFALIMGLGIIVDDAIVVGEDALTHMQQGEASLLAAEGGAQRMFWPVLASSLTTIAAFMPLMLVRDYIGAMLFAIPLVMICVILASLIECFLILPGHLRSSFQSAKVSQDSALRRKLDAAFDRFRNDRFRPVVTWAVDHRWLTWAFGVALLILAVGLVLGGRVKFTFFPAPEIPVVMGNAQFVAGTQPERVKEFLDQAEKALWETDAEFGSGLVRTAVVWEGMQMVPGSNFFRQGEQYGLVVAELVGPDQRTVRNEEFTRAWQARIKQPAALERFSTFSPSAGPPGRDIELRLSGEDSVQLKRAAEALAERLHNIEGVSGIDDDMPWGREQLLYSLTPEGEALGLSVARIGEQLRAAYDGQLVQIFQDDGSEVEVRVVLPDAERDQLANLDSIPIVLDGGATVPLSNVVKLRATRGFERIRHKDGQRAILVSADIDESVNNAGQVREIVNTEILPELESQYGVSWAGEGQGQNQEETLTDMKRGSIYALILIYLVLAWVFGSYGWPLVVMSIIPFGLTGAIVGHWLLGIDFTILSMFGFFALSGIVVNDAIILVVFYKQLREQGVPVRQALIDSASRRLRAVLLTSLTTIGGLTPLMFETSLQASFLIPMAASITFGLAFATVLVLVLIPSLLYIYEDWSARRPFLGGMFGGKGRVH